MELKPLSYRIINTKTKTVVGILSAIPGSAWWRAEWIDYEPGYTALTPNIRCFDGFLTAEQFFNRMG